MPRAPENPRQILLPVLADLMPRGDGSYILRPRLPGPEMDTWLTPKQVASHLGVSKRAVYDLLDETEPLLASRRPLPRKILVSLASVREFARLTADPAFWSDPKLRQGLVSASRQRIAELSAKPL